MRLTGEQSRQPNHRRIVLGVELLEPLVHTVGWRGSVDTTGIGERIHTYHDLTDTSLVPSPADHMTLHQQSLGTPS